MTTRKTVLKLAEASAKQKAAARLSSRERLAQAIGPQAYYAFAPNSDVELLFVRPDLVSLTKHKDWPQPLTAMARTLVYEGDKTLRVPEKLDQYLELQHRIIVELARVEPPELLAAKDADDADYEAKIAAWAEGGKVGTMPQRGTQHRDAALRGLVVDNLKPLFVVPGEEPDEDQLVLLVPGDGLAPSPAESSIRLTIQDLLVLTGAALTNQAGSMSRFRV